MTATILHPHPEMGLSAGRELPVAYLSERGVTVNVGGGVKKFLEPHEVQLAPHCPECWSQVEVGGACRVCLVMPRTAAEMGVK